VIHEEAEEGFLGWAPQGGSEGEGSVIRHEDGLDVALGAGVSL